MGEWWRIKERDVLVNKSCPVCPPGAKRENRLNYLGGGTATICTFQIGRRSHFSLIFQGT